MGARAFACLLLQLSAASSAYTVTTIVGDGSGGSSDGTGTNARLAQPRSGIVATASVVYVADTGNHKIRKITLSTGAITTLAGTGMSGSSDGVGTTTAQFNQPWGLALRGERLYVSDQQNRKIRYIDLANDNVYTVAGSGDFGSADGVGTAATFDEPKDIVLSSDESYLYVAMGDRIRQIEVSGYTVTTPVALTGLSNIAGLAISATNLYYCTGVSAHSVYSYSFSTTQVTTLAGRGSAAGPSQGWDFNADGVGTNAGFAYPEAVTLSSDGTKLFVADTSNYLIRQIEISTSTVTTLAGYFSFGKATGSAIVDNDGTLARFNSPSGLYATSSYVYIADKNNNAVRRMALPSPPPSTPPPTPPFGSGASGDPHIVFANGGKADFRGSHLDSYAFLSSPGFQFAPFFEAVDYMYTSPYSYKQIVHGTFMTAAHWIIQTAAGREVLIEVDAVQGGKANVTVNGKNISLTRWQRMVVDDVNITTQHQTVTVEEPRWQVSVTSKGIYGALAKWWVQVPKRLDLSIKGAFPQPDAHGIIGQSYRDARVRNGAQDEYETPMSRINEEGYAPEMVTSAQAEGAIDGTHVDYKLTTPYSTNFTYSAFAHPRVAKAFPLETRVSLTLEKNQDAPAARA